VHPHEIFVIKANFLRKKNISLVELENKIMAILAPQTTEMIDC
jgi:hypothetical protein